MKNSGRMGYIFCKAIGWLHFLIAFLYALLVGSGAIFRLRAGEMAFRNSGEFIGSILDLLAYVLTGLLFVRIAALFKDGNIAVRYTVRVLWGLVTVGVISLVQRLILPRAVYNTAEAIDTVQKGGDSVSQAVASMYQMASLTDIEQILIPRIGVVEAMTLILILKFYGANTKAHI